MLRTALVGLATAVALTAGATEASAKKWNVDVHIGGGPGFYGGPVYHPYYPIYDNGPDCYYVKKKKLVNIGGIWKKKYINVLICD
jgi:hypothetical protein